MIAVSYLVHNKTLLQNTRDNIAKCDSYFFTKCDTHLLQNASAFLLQNVTFLLENATVFIKCDNFFTKYDVY